MNSITDTLGLKGRIAILGAGREGLATFEYLKDARVEGEIEIITESLSGSEEEQRLKEEGVVRVCPLGEADLEDFDILVRSPGISPYRGSIQSAIRAGVQIVSPSTIWFANNPDQKTIVITGTKGKSTTASLLTHMLRSAGLTARLAGNIGEPLLACEDTGVDWWVIELSSYQLADLDARPTLGVILNLASDHLDWHGSQERYHADKLRLATLLDGHCLVANGSDAKLRAGLVQLDNVRWFEGDRPDPLEVSMPQCLPGRHNRANLEACLQVTRELGLSDHDVLQTLGEFEGLPHRLRQVGEFNGVRYVDDSISTAPVATVAALEALQGEKVVLLAGGLDRGVDWSPYIDAITRHAPAGLIALPDNGAKILETLENYGIKPELGSSHAENLQEAVKMASEMVGSGGVVLLSPGAPSFPQFKNFEDRGLKFAEFCKQIAGSQ